MPLPRLEVRRRGANTEIPYSERINRSAKLRTYPAAERNGFIYAWYHPHQEPPTYDIPVVEEILTDDFSGPTKTNHVVETGIQEMAENGVDSAHFRYVHNVEEVPVIERYDIEGHRTIMESKQRFPTPRGVVDGRIDATAEGPGVSIVRFSGIIDTILVTASTPIRSDQTETRFHFYVRNLGDEATNSTVGEAFAAEVDKQFIEDMPIWEHKAHLVRPALADTDGPFMKFRKWYSQFYVDARERRPHRLPAAVLAREDGRVAGQGHRLGQAWAAPGRSVRLPADRGRSAGPVARWQPAKASESGTPRSSSPCPWARWRRWPPLAPSSWHPDHQPRATEEGLTDQAEVAETTRRPRRARSKR